MSKPSPATGTCLCGAVTLEAVNVAEHYGACHCGMCRKWGGGPLMAIECGADVVINGEDSVTVFDSSPWAERAFCAHCGTHLFYRLKQTGDCHVPLGFFGDQIAPAFSVQVFIDRKPESYAFANETRMLTETQIIEMYAPKS